MNGAAEGSEVGSFLPIQLPTVEHDLVEGVTHYFDLNRPCPSTDTLLEIFTPNVMVRRPTCQEENKEVSLKYWKI